MEVEKNELETLLSQLEGQITDEDRSQMTKYYNLVKAKFSEMTDAQLRLFADASKLDYKNQLEEYKDDYVPRHGPDSGPELGHAIEKWCKSSNLDLNPYDEGDQENFDEFMMWNFEGAVFDVLKSRKLI